MSYFRAGFSRGFFLPLIVRDNEYSVVTHRLHAYVHVYDTPQSCDNNNNKTHVWIV